MPAARVGAGSGKLPLFRPCYFTPSTLSLPPHSSDIGGSRKEDAARNAPLSHTHRAHRRQVSPSPVTVLIQQWRKEGKKIKIKI
ncbi:hypothetical protein U1Q18_044984 [Sarracenia purpurea var. burkii]